MSLKTKTDKLKTAIIKVTNPIKKKIDEIRKYIEANTKDSLIIHKV